MARSYNKLWKLMIDKKMNKTQLRTTAKISSNAMAKLGRDESVPIETLEKFVRFYTVTSETLWTFCRKARNCGNDTRNHGNSD